MGNRNEGIEREIGELRSVLDRLLQEEDDLGQLVAGVSRLTAVIVQASRLQLQIAAAEERDDD